ncbi:fibronectin type III domain-containing protein [Lachnospiraceae bacterium OttesenSCG-928-D06]|nr:fibronectin type III domain-containing protein [Lachnospiraceae bacterium OttesenSCG-928-D06]
MDETKKTDSILMSTAATTSYEMQGDGTKNNPYIISDMETFDNIRNNLSAYYKLTSNIDFQGKIVIPIGNLVSTPFKGTIDGDGYTIRNFVIDSSATYPGLFGISSSAVFRNLILENGESKKNLKKAQIGILASILNNCSLENIEIVNPCVFGGEQTGALFGSVSGGSVKNCVVRGNIEVESLYRAGGLGGYAIDAEITKCFVKGRGIVKGVLDAGGLIGYAPKSTINQCFADIDIESGNYTGGLVGIANGNISECYALGKVTGKYAGGLLGSSNGTIKNCFALGDVTSSINHIYTGGLIGYSTGRVEKCYAAGLVSESGSGLVYATSTGSTFASYFDSVTTGVTADNICNKGKQTVTLIQKRFYTEWDFENVWNIEDGISYPYLQNMEKPEMPIHNINTRFDGIGTQEEPYLIRDIEDFQYINYDMSGCYKLITDIDATGRKISPIGTATSWFSGSFDGDNYTLENVKIDLNETYVGLFRYAESATFRNLFVKGGEIMQSSSFKYAGILAGYANACVIDNINLLETIVNGGEYSGTLIGYMKDCIVSKIQIKNISVVGGQYSGGLVGYSIKSSLKHCEMEGEAFVTGVFCVGGIAGIASDTEISNCVVKSYGIINGKSVVGGLVGDISRGNIQKSYAVIDISGEDIIGGLIGRIQSVSPMTEVSECYATGNVIGKTNVGGFIGAASGCIRDCFAVGSVTSTTNSTSVGGMIVGSSSAQIINCFAIGKTSASGSGFVAGTARVTNSYFDSVTVGLFTSNEKNIGKMTGNLKRKDTFIGWDFENIWNIDEKNSYPYLKNLPRPRIPNINNVVLPVGVGTREDPYLINNETFKYIRCEVDAHYKLISDVDCMGEEIEPIGILIAPYTGELDGNGYAIKNFKIKKQGSYTGLFGYALNASFRNLRIENVELTTTGSYIGALAGYLDYCTVEKICLMDISISGHSYSGSLVGYVNRGCISECLVKGNSIVTGSTEVGGLLGISKYTEISSCFVDSNGSVKSNSNAGGLIGRMDYGTLEKSYASIEVISGKCVGGLVGLMSAAAKISECYAVGNVIGNTIVGGLIGSSTSSSSINNSYAKGSVTSTSNSALVGGLIGSTAKISVANCYATGLVSTKGNGLLYNSGGVTVSNSYFDSTTAGTMITENWAKSSEEMFSKETYIGWDWNDIWVYEDSQYPKLKNTIIPKELISFEILTHSLTSHSVMLEWSDIENAIEYEICFANRKEHTNESSILITNLDSATYYEFRVQAKTSDVRTIYSKTAKLMTKELPIVTGLHSISKGINSLELRWNSIEGAEYYEVIYGERREKTLVNHIILTELYENIIYSIRVKVVLKDGTTSIGCPLVETMYGIQPQTDYGRQFVEKCKNQIWFINEVENRLSVKGKSINTICSSEDFSTVYAINHSNQSSDGVIPEAIGEFYNLKYLYLSLEDLESKLPDEIKLLKDLKIIRISS